MSGRKQRNLKATRVLRFIHVPHRIASCQLCRHHDLFALQSPEPEMPDIMNIWYQGVRENLTEGNTHLPLWCYDSHSFCFGSFFPPCPSFIQSHENDECSSRQKVEMKSHAKICGELAWCTFIFVFMHGHFIPGIHADSNFFVICPALLDFCACWWRVKPLGKETKPCSLSLEIGGD